jgi:hypothetical protein
VVLEYSSGPWTRDRRAAEEGVRRQSTAHGVAAAGAEAVGQDDTVAAAERTAVDIGDTTAGRTAAHGVAGGIAGDGSRDSAPEADTRIGIHSAVGSVPWGWQEGRRAS